MKQVKDLTESEKNCIKELLKQFNSLGEERLVTGGHNKFRSTKQRTDIINKIAEVAGIPSSGKSSNQRMKYNRWNATIDWLEENGLKTRNLENKNDSSL